MGKNIILVHGLWNRGWSMAALAKRLRARGHQVRVFSYPTRSDCLDGHADELHEFIGQETVEELNLVGHSLGGLVILDMLDRYDDLPPGRVVLMGTPVQGASVVKRLEKLPGHQLMFGKIKENLLKGYDKAPNGRQTGMIYGTRSLGLGRMTGAGDEPGDGSVNVSETLLHGLQDRVEMQVAHSEMLISSAVVAQVHQFILRGNFNHQD